MLRKWKRQAESSAREEKGKPLPRLEDAQQQLVGMLTGSGASRFMPAAISNSHAAVEEALNRLDPRARVETSYASGAASYTVLPREPINFKLVVPESSGSAWREGMRALIEHGREARLPAAGLIVTGSPLLERLFGELSRGDGELRFAPSSREAALKVALRDPVSGQAESFDDIPGRVSGGQRSVNFSGVACSGALGLSLSFGLGGDAAERSLSITHDFSGWSGLEVSRISHFEKTRRLTERLRSGWCLDFALEIDGEEAVRGSATPSGDFMPEQAGILEHLSRLRTISKELGKPIRYSAHHALTREEFGAAFEVAETFAGRWSFTESGLSEPPRATLTARGNNIETMLRDPGDMSVLGTETGGFLAAFGMSIPLPDRFTRIQGFRAELAREIPLASIRDVSVR